MADSLIIGTVLWTGLCICVAVVLLRRFGGSPLLREQALLLIGVGLLAIAPCTYLLLLWLNESPSAFGSGLQLSGAVLMFAAAWRARQVRLDPQESAGTWAFRQKSALVVLAALCILIFSYFSKAWSVPADQAFAVFVDAIVQLVVLMIVGHIIIALFHGPADELDTPRDERDHAIDLFSMRNAYYVLTAGFLAMPVVIIAQLPLAKALNIWFALLVIAEVIYYSSVIAYYRFGTG